MSREFQLQKIAADCAMRYFNTGIGRMLGVRNTTFDLFARVKDISSWEAGKLADRAWTALEKQRDAAGRRAG